MSQIRHAMPPRNRKVYSTSSVRMVQSLEWYIRDSTIKNIYILRKEPPKQAIFSVENKQNKMTDRTKYKYFQKLHYEEVQYQNKNDLW